jgi:transcriptional regulator with XRE-family HTH domain
VPGANWARSCGGSGIGSGLTVEEVAEQLDWSSSKMNRLENAARGSIPLTARNLMDLARASRQLGWWTQYSDLKLFR